MRIYLSERDWPCALESKWKRKKNAKVKHKLTRIISTATEKHILRDRHDTLLTFHSLFTDSCTRLET